MAGTIVEVLSAGAVEPGLIAASRAFEARGGDGIRIEWATTPAIRKRIDAGEVFDLLIVPKAALDELAAAGRLIAQEDVALGRVGVGVAARTGMASPDGIKEVAGLLA